MVKATPADKSLVKKMLAPFITTPPGDKMDLYLIPSSKKINDVATGIPKKNIFITEDGLPYLDEDFFISGLMAIRFEYRSDEFAKKKGYGKNGENPRKACSL